MSGCNGCLESPKGQLIQLEAAIKQATEYAKENKKSMAIFKESGEYRICEAFYAYQHGYPVVRVVSFHISDSPK